MFEYKVAEAMFDVFAARQDEAFGRAYAKLKGLLQVAALVDHGTAKPRGLALAWQDLNMAFRGRHTWCLMGAVIELWEELHEDDDEQFVTLIEQAFTSAEKATKEGTKLRYKNWRESPVLRCEDDWVSRPACPDTYTREKEQHSENRRVQLTLIEGGLV